MHPWVLPLADFYPPQPMRPFSQWYSPRQPVRYRMNCNSQFEKSMELLYKQAGECILWTALLKSARTGWKFQFLAFPTQAMTSSFPSMLLRMSDSFPMPANPSFQRTAIGGR